MTTENADRGFREMRRQDRAMTSEDAEAILRRGEWGVLSMVDGAGDPYGVPISYVYEGDTIYLHCALEGRKVDALRCHPVVSFCVVDRATTLPERFSVDLASVIVCGEATEVTGDRKQLALSTLIAKYSPDFVTEGEAYIASASDKTMVVEIAIERITGKARQRP